MTMSDPLGDMLTRVRNGQRAGKSKVVSPFSNLRFNVLDVLQYHEGQPVIREIARVSKPGRRVYSKIKELPRYYNGLGICIISTPRGVMADHEARAAKVGGEILCRVF